MIGAHGSRNSPCALTVPLPQRRRRGLTRCCPGWRPGPALVANSFVPPGGGDSEGHLETVLKVHDEARRVPVTEIEAAISITDWRIRMSLQPEGPGRLAAMLAVPTAEGDRLWDQMASAALRHEMGHWDYCPFSGQWNAAILEGIGQALRNRPFRHKDAVVRRMANFFCDLIVNATLAARGQAAGQFAEGLATHLVKEWARVQAEGGLSKEYRFSGQSYFSGWQSWYRLGAMKRVLLAYQGRGTVLDNEVFRHLRQQAHRPFAAIMITDGAIANADEVLLGVGEILREGHKLVLIQIGRETPFAKGAGALGAEVHCLDSVASLPGLILGRVRRQYG